jgi:hypothetical protein
MAHMGLRPTTEIQDSKKLKQFDTHIAKRVGKIRVTSLVNLQSGIAYHKFEAFTRKKNP